LRLKREGNKLVAGWSQDDKNWKDYDAMEVDWGRKVKVGVVAENIYKKAFEATFDKYALSVPDK
jgi:regulation of enolase protein 1 (concanavalin A-like superfamily)